MESYGKELILDLHNCDPSTFTRESIRDYFKELCVSIDMQREVLYFWDDRYTPPDERQTDPKLKGTSAIQFILTSNITIHTLDLLANVYINIFSCKDFDADAAGDLTAKWFKGDIVKSNLLIRR